MAIDACMLECTDSVVKIYLCKLFCFHHPNFYLQMLTQNEWSDTFWTRGWFWGKTNTTHATSQKPARSPIYPVLHRVFIFHICISKSTWLHVIDNVLLPCSEMFCGRFTWQTFLPPLLINEKGMCLIIRRHGMINFLAFFWRNWLQHLWGVTSRRRPPKCTI